MKKILSFIIATSLIICSCVSFFAPFLHGGQAEASSDQKIYATSIDDTFYQRGGENLGSTQERIDYAYKIEDRYFNPSKLPGYLSNYTCGIHAGGNIIGYYDLSYEELIPDHTIKYIWGQWFYGSQGTQVDAMFDSLYTRMGATSAGVTLNGYKNGLASYATSKGRTMTYTKSMASNGVLNKSLYKTAIQNGKLMSIFVDGFAILTLTELLTHTNYDTVNLYIYSGAHIMAVYGYWDISYYNAAGQCFRSDSYLFVHTGFSAGLGLLKLNQYAVIDDAYINHIT